MATRYLSVATLKSYVQSSLVLADTLYEDAIKSAEQTLDNACGRRFELVGAAAVATARTFYPTGSRWLRIHDCTEITVVLAGGATLTVDTEYSVEPLNGVSESGEPMPYSALWRTGGWWPYSSYGVTSLVTVTAKWGWPAIPPQILEACKILARDTFEQRAVKFGLVGGVSFAGGGGRAQENLIVRDAIRDYRLGTSLVGV